MIQLDLDREGLSRTGTEIAVSDWMTVDQKMVDEFAEATDDPQWIHIDPVRAARETPFGGTIAHGLLTLSLLPKLIHSTLSIEPRRTVSSTWNRTGTAPW